jgi:hypothetical protein
VFTLKWIQTAQDSYDELKTQAIRVTAKRQSKAKRKSSKQEGLSNQVEKTLRLLMVNPKHPGLRTHEYEAIENPCDKNQKVFEAYAQNETPGEYRVFWCYGRAENELAIIAITPHP